MGGLIGIVLKFFHTTKNGAKVSDTTVNAGGGANKTCEHFQPANEDSVPLNGDYAILVSIPRSGGMVTVGYVDKTNQQLASAGEKRLYSRDENSVQKCEIWLKKTGEISISNANGNLRLNVDGTINANDAIITTNGDVITASGVSLNNHTHAQGNDSGGSVEQETNPPTQ